MTPVTWIVVGVMLWAIVVAIEAVLQTRRRNGELAAVQAQHDKDRRSWAHQIWPLGGVAVHECQLGDTRASPEPAAWVDFMADKRPGVWVDLPTAGYEAMRLGDARDFTHNVLVRAKDAAVFPIAGTVSRSSVAGPVTMRIEEI